jgi:hypothetical protein
MMMMMITGLCCTWVAQAGLELTIFLPQVSGVLFYFKKIIIKQGS